jgi:mannose-6-phosphate isomerase-like protein (cupin superfamily)
MLLAENRSRPIETGDIVRTPVGEVHGPRNTGSRTFVYLEITTPPADFRAAYASAR